MYTITRANNPFSIQNIATSKALLAILLVIGISSVLAISYIVSSAPATKTTLTQPIQTTEPLSIKVTALPQARPLAVDNVNSTRRATQILQPNNVSLLQPAQNTVQISGATTNALQPSANSVQITGENIQNAEIVLQ